MAWELGFHRFSNFERETSFPLEDEGLEQGKEDSASFLPGGGRKTNGGGDGVA